jgi:hypothetical protein
MFGRAGTCELDANGFFVDRRDFLPDEGKAIESEIEIFTSKASKTFSPILY